MLGANSSETVPAAWKLKGFWRLVRFIGRCCVFLLFLKLFLFGNETFISKVSFSALLEPSSDLRAFYTLEAPDVSVASWNKTVRFQRRTARGLGLAIRSSCGAGSQNGGDDSSTCHFGLAKKSQAVDFERGGENKKDVEL